MTVHERNLRIIKSLPLVKAVYHNINILTDVLLLSNQLFYNKERNPLFATFYLY